jgi:hypothetical protein
MSFCLTGKLEYPEVVEEDEESVEKRAKGKRV